MKWSALHIVMPIEFCITIQYKCTNFGKDFLFGLISCFLTFAKFSRICGEWYFKFKLPVVKFVILK